MALRFNYTDPNDPQNPVDLTFKCGDLHTTLWKQPAEIIKTRTNFWGVNGVSEIVSPGVGPELITVNVWITDATYTADKAGADLLWNYLKSLDGIRGYHGTVFQEGATVPIHRSYLNCTFEGFTPEVHAGREAPDFVQLCNVQNCFQWVQAGSLMWTTLRAFS